MITGPVKDCFPCRACFKVSRRQDSLHVLDAPGAESLLGGDMLFMPGDGSLQRIHGTLLSDEEIQHPAGFWKRQRAPQYDAGLSAKMSGSPYAGSVSDLLADMDPFYREVLDFVFQNGEVSAFLLEQRFRIGFSTAARYMELLDSDSLLGPSAGDGLPRPVVRRL